MNMGLNKTAIQKLTKKENKPTTPRKKKKKKNNNKLTHNIFVFRLCFILFILIVYMNFGRSVWLFGYIWNSDFAFRNSFLT